MAARVELFEAIQIDWRREQLSVRALAERHQVHRRTVRQALASAVPPARKSYPRPRPAIGPWTEIINAWLDGDGTVPRKQHHAARRIWQRLGDEHGAHLFDAREGGTMFSVRQPWLGSGLLHGNTFRCAAAPV